jgi:hypothetical protein
MPSIEAPWEAYVLLEIKRDASQGEIKLAHRRLMKKWHPDANDDTVRAEERTKNINWAYEQLRGENRKIYDAKQRTKESKDRERAMKASRARSTDQAKSFGDDLRSRSANQPKTRATTSSGGAHGGGPRAGGASPASAPPPAWAFQPVSSPASPSTLGSDLAEALPLLGGGLLLWLGPVGLFFATIGNPDNAEGIGVGLLMIVVGLCGLVGLPMTLIALWLMLVAVVKAWWN